MIAHRIAFLFRFFTRPERRSRVRTQVRHIHTARPKALPDAKQAELEILCNTLFRQRESITPGRLRLIGLEGLKKRMGDRWDTLHQTVHDTVESTLKAYLETYDLYIRYKDDSYIVIFTRATPEESRLRGEWVAREVRRHLSALEDENARAIRVRQSCATLRTGSLAHLAFPDLLEAMDAQIPESPEEEKAPRPLAPSSPKTASGNADPAPVPPPAPPTLRDLVPECAWLPLWDAPHEALSAALCLSPGGLAVHRARCAQADESGKATLDTDMIRAVSAELMRMEEEGRKTCLVCPLQYETLARFESYESCRTLIARIPEARRALLILLLLCPEMLDPTPAAFCFVRPLRALCPGVFTEIPMRHALRFGNLRSTGLNGTALCLPEKRTPEGKEEAALIGDFGTRAAALKIPRTVLLGIETPMLAMTAVYAGIHYLGGPAIRPLATSPGTALRCRYEDLSPAPGKRA